MASCQTVIENTEPVSFNEGWKFYKGEASNAQNLNFDDSRLAGSKFTTRLGH